LNVNGKQGNKEDKIAALHGSSRDNRRAIAQGGVELDKQVFELDK
jgi:hypothetical protein